MNEVCEAVPKLEDTEERMEDEGTGGARFMRAMAARSVITRVMNWPQKMAIRLDMNQVVCSVLK